MGDLYALDFDGVLCDSCGESSISAVKAAKARWPSLFNGVDSSLEDWIVGQMHVVNLLVVAVGFMQSKLVQTARLIGLRLALLPKDTQIFGLDYSDTFYSVAKIASVLLFLSIVVVRCRPLYQLDIIRI